MEILIALAACFVAITARNRAVRLEGQVGKLSGRIGDLEDELRTVKRKLAPAPAASPREPISLPTPPPQPESPWTEMPLRETPRAIPAPPPPRAMVIVAPAPSPREPISLPRPSPQAESPWTEMPLGEPARDVPAAPPPQATVTVAPAAPPTLESRAGWPWPSVASPERPAEKPSTSAPRDIETWEAAIGGSWLNRIGVTLVVIGIAFALGYSLTVLGAAGKAALATLVSLSLIGAGLFFEKKETFRLYGRGLIAGGWAALYATAYAVHALQATRIVEDPRAGFALLILVGAGMIVHSLRYENEGITSLAYALAYAAIALHSISAYTLAAGSILGFGTVMHLVRRRWYRIAFGGMAATYGCLFLWYVRQGEMSAGTLKLGLGALLLDWITFLVADFAPEPDSEKARGNARIVSLLNAVAAGSLSYLAWSKFSHAGAWLPLAILGGLYAIMSGVLRQLGRRAVHPIHSVAAALLLGLAAREGLGLHAATWGWLIEAQAVVLIGLALSDRFHRILGCVLFLAPSIAIFYDQIGERLDRVEGLWNPQQFALTTAACAAFYLTFARLKAFAGERPDGHLEENLRKLFSFGAFALMIAGLWVQLPRVYVAPAGAALMVLLFELSALRLLLELRTQAYLAAAFTIATALALTAPSKDLLAGHAALIPALLIVSAGFFILFLRRRGEKSPLVDADERVRGILPWIGTGFAVLLIGLGASPRMVGPGWVLLAVLVIEAGIALRERALRHPGYALLLAGPASLVLSNLTADNPAGGWSIRTVTLIPSIAATFFLWWRLRRLGMQPAASGPRVGDAIDDQVRAVLTWLGTAFAALLVWLEAAPVMVGPAWMILGLVLVEAGFALKDLELRRPGYAAALCAVAATLALSAPSKELLWGHEARIPALLIVSASFFILFFRRRGVKASLGELEGRMGSVFPWAGTVFAALLVWLEARPVMVGPAWILMALILVEAGIALRERALRHPGYALLLGGHASFVLSNLTATDLVGGWSIRAVTLIPSIAATYYLWWRLREMGSEPGAGGAPAGDAMDERFGRFLCYAGGTVTGLFVRFEFGLEGAAFRWSLAMIVLFFLGYLFRDADFRIQGYVLAGAVFLRAVGFDFQEAGPILGVDGPLAIAVVSVACYVGAALFLRSKAPAAADARGDRRSFRLESELEARGFDILSFLAVAIAAVYSFRTHSGFMLIVAWAIEGLLASVAGFLLEARTLRFTGLGLLAAGLAMTLYRITTFTPIGKIVSFLVLGVVLLLVSFGYTRYRGKLRKPS